MDAIEMISLTFSKPRLSNKPKGPNA